MAGRAEQVLFRCQIAISLNPFMPEVPMCRLVGARYLSGRIERYLLISQISVSLDWTRQLRCGSKVGSNVTVILPSR